jgi:GTPase SAR1 family protein
VLLQAIKTQVETRLESSLHNRVYIIPDKDKNPSQVEHPWNIDVKSGSKPKFRLPKNTSIINVFDQAGVEGRLLILGKPGAGKTTMLLELAKVLVQRAEEDLNEPVPVLLSLSSWQNDHQSITDWIVAELSSRKYYRVRKDITKQWLEYGEIIPLLDGLDELAAERQEKCVEKLNNFLQPGNWINPLVVCSRIEEYQIYSTQLALNTSVELQPFNDKQIQDYLQRTGNEPLWNSIKDNAELTELAQTPFFLNVIVLSSQKLSLDKWQIFQSSQERIDYLFSAYVEEMLSRQYKDKHPSDENTKRWLSWLSIKLIEQNESEIFIDKMQPYLFLSHKQKLVSSIILFLFLWIFHAVIVGYIVGLFFNYFIGKLFGVLFGLCYAFVVIINNGLIPFLSSGTDKLLEINAAENLEFSLSKLKNKMTWKFIQEFLIEGFFTGIIVGLMSVFILKQRVGSPLKGLLGGLALGIMGGLFGMLFEGLKGLEIETRKTPNQGIKQSGANILWLMMASYPISFIISIYLNWWTTNNREFYLILIIALLISLLVGLNRAGKPVIQHSILRIILYFNGYIPWNYAHFLNNATKRLFLQRVGGGYRFIHDFLRQHFATNYR